MPSSGMLASVVGRLLLSSQWDHTVGQPLSRATPATPEIVRLVRDEHDLVAGMVKEQLVLRASGSDPTSTASAERRQHIALR
jgi:hypothetical protein